MKREKVQEVLMGQLALLSKTHVDDLMRTRRHEELERVLEDVSLKIYPIRKFCEEEDFVYLEGEIPEDIPLYELICFMKYSGLHENDLFESEEELQKILEQKGEETGEEVLRDLAELLTVDYICNYPMKELLEKKEEEE